MPRLSFLKKLFKSKASSAPASDPRESKESSSHILPALRASTKARCHTLRTAFRSTTTSSPRSVDVSVFEDDVDVPHILPEVGSIGGDLNLSFEHEADCKSDDYTLGIEGNSHAGSVVVSRVEESSLLVPVACDQQTQASSPATTPAEIEVRNSIFITSDARDDPETTQPHSGSLVHSSHGLTTVSIIAEPLSPFVRAQAEAASPNVVVRVENGTSSSGSDDRFLDDFDNTLHFSSEPQSDTSVSEITKEDLSSARDAIYDAPLAVEAQQALLDFADVYAAAAHTTTGEISGATGRDREEEISNDQTTSTQELDLLKAEHEGEAQAQFQVFESSQAVQISDNLARAAVMYKKTTGLSPDQWKDLVKKLTPIHHKLLEDFKKLQAHLQELEAKQEKTESALRDAQSEAWTKIHLHEEVSRALELSKQMHKEANECAVISAEKFEKLEIRFEVNRKVTERMLADSWQANASKDERIRILATTLVPDEMTQKLHDKQAKLHEVEARLVATQRLVEALQEQLTNAQAERTGIEVENKKLECQLGEAKMRLDHDCQDEERLRTELERANADVKEVSASSNRWQHIAVSKLDEYAPEVIMQVKGTALQTLQDKMDEAAGKLQAMAEHTRALEIDADDLRYELSINERRLRTDESIKISFYEQHWSTVQEVFDDNKAKTAMIKGFETRFSQELAKKPMIAAEVGPETFEDCVGPEFIDRSNALYRMMDEAAEARGEYDLRRSDLDREKIKAIYGHGPAGYQPRPEREMPEGYPERKAARDIADLKWQVKDLKAKLWQAQRRAEGGHVEGEDDCVEREDEYVEGEDNYVDGQDDYVKGEVLEMGEEAKGADGGWTTTEGEPEEEDQASISF